MIVFWNVLKNILPQKSIKDIASKAVTYLRVSSTVLQNLTIP